ncbi:MAG: molybdopterin-dependent oxidoreductase [Desulfoprunum sp.]|uniref:molybdopterin-dependent oxidoreductase n=1 Tax=Desulfoprunum sp. TaxID=2020866 RepID=UPI00068B8280
MVADKERAGARRLRAGIVKEERKTVCPLDCPDSCGMVATVEDGRIVSLRGDRDHPFTRGFICRKMRRYIERVYTEDRLLYPQVRTGAKGDGRFSRIGWDEAWDILTTRLAAVVNRHGGEAVLPYSYAGNMGVVNRFAGHAFFYRLGALRLDETICFAAAGAAWARHCGTAPGSPPEVAADAELIVAWGINIKVTNVHFWPLVAEARQKGGRLLVIDPYRNATGRAADRFVAVKPGGDAALALGLIKFLVEDDRLDRAMLERQTIGFERLEGYLRGTPWQEFTTASGVGRTEMAELARTLHRNSGTFFRIGVGLTRNSRGGMAVRAILSLAAVLGLFQGGPGRGVLLSTLAFRGNRDRLQFPELAEHRTPIVNMIQLGQALTVRQPAIRALFVYNANPLSACSDARTVRRGLCRDDLFTVVHDQVMTPTARYADLLLPATTFLENRDLYTAYGHFHLGVVDPVIPPQGEAISNFDLFQTLARKMGFAEAPFRQTVDARITGFLQDMEGLPADIPAAGPTAGTWLQSTRGGRNGGLFAGNDGRFVFSADHGPEEPPFACLTKPGEFGDPDLRSRFPFKLLIPPHPDLLNSTFGERYAGEHGTVLIHPEDAATAGAGEGDLVRIENHRGRIVRRARLSRDTQRGLLVAEGLFWPVEPDDGGINDLSSQKLSDMGGGATFHESRVAIARL